MSRPIPLQPGPCSSSKSHPERSHLPIPDHDRDSIFSGEVDDDLRAFGLKVLRTPVRVPKANAYCQRLMGTIRGVVGCFPMIDWAGCTTVTIGRPSPKTFPSILNKYIGMCPVDVWAAWAPRGWVKGPRALSTGKMQAQKFTLGQKESSHSRRMTFRRAHKGIDANPTLPLEENPTHNRILFRGRQAIRICNREVCSEILSTSLYSLSIYGEMR
jgi:hypothetical protein